MKLSFVVLLCVIGCWQIIKISILIADKEQHLMKRVWFQPLVCLVSCSLVCVCVCELTIAG